MIEAVARGVAFLNKHYPGWQHKIDLEKLDMNSDKYDIMGQVSEFRWLGLQNWQELEYLGLGFRLGDENTRAETEWRRVLSKEICIGQYVSFKTPLDQLAPKNIGKVLPKTNYFDNPEIVKVFFPTSYTSHYCIDQLEIVYLVGPQCQK